MPIRTPGASHRRPRIEGDRIAVDRDADLVQPVLGFTTAQLRGQQTQVNEQQMRVGAAGEHTDAMRLGVWGQQLLGHRLSALQRANLALAEQLGGGDLRATALAAITCCSGPPCWPGDGGVNLLLQLLFAEDQATARAA